MKIPVFCSLHRVMAAELIGAFCSRMVAMVLLNSLVLQGQGGAGVLLGYSSALQLPSLLVAPLAGPLLDRMGSGKIMFLLNLFRGLIIIALAGFWQVHYLSLSLLALITFLDNIWYASRSALLPGLARHRSLLHVNGMMLRLSVVAGILGPPLAGYMAIEVSTSLCLVSTGALCSLFTLFLLNLPKERGKYIEGKGWADQFKEGFHLLVTNRELSTGVRMLALSSFGAGMMNFAVPLLFKLRGFTVDTYGITVGSFALGQLGATLLLHGIRFKQDRTFIPPWVFFLQGLSMIGILMAGNTLSLGVVFVLMGSASGLCQIFLESFFQVKSEPSYRGRVMSLTCACRGGCYLAAGLAGAAVASLGAPLIVAAAALTTASCGSRLIQSGWKGSGLEH